MCATAQIICFIWHTLTLFKPRTPMKILMVLTSHDKLGDTGKRTGFWLEEFAAPYYVFKDAGVTVTLASPLGGQPPIDPGSDTASAQTDATRRFKDDASAQVALANTLKLGDMKAADFDAVFYPGGHGPLWDLAENAYSMTLIETMLSSDKPVGLVCHALGALRHVVGSDGNSVVKGRSVTGFSNTEEKAVGLTGVVPFLTEDMLRQNGGHYAKTDDWLPFVVTDGLLVTGQNPASSAPAATALLTIATLNSKNNKELA
jgi:putative intracellular protease/amidase